MGNSIFNYLYRGIWITMNCCWCGYEMTIVETDEDFYYMKEDDGLSYWTDEMIECKVEDEMSLDKAGQITDFEYEGLAYTLPDGYIFKDENGNVINATKIVLEKKEYPKTYEKCCKVLNTDDDSIIDISVPLHYNHLLISFTQLLICRDAYWKIAGDEMGLGKPWEPDWTYNGATKYCIGVSENEIQSFNSGVAQYIFAFPTPEMRDTFKKNFDPDIEICKELL